MDSLEHLQWSTASKQISWRYKGRNFSQTFNNSIGHVLKLQDASGFIIIESVQSGGADNASIWNSDGTLRCRPRNPFDNASDMVFYYAEYGEEGLRIIVAGRSRDFWFYIDETSCELLDRHEAR